MTAKTISPIDNSVVYEQAFASQQHIDTTIEQARDAQQAWAELSVEQRASICRRAVDYFIQNSEAIGSDITHQMGRPIRYSVNEVKGVQERALHMIDIAPQVLADINIEDSEQRRRLIRKNPLGVVFVVAPWNYPLLTTVNSVFPALMSGNSVVIKPSIQTPLVGEHFTRSFEQAGAPKGLVQALCLNHQSTSALLGSGAIDYCCFTGSVNAGKKMEAAIAGTFKGLTLELGGKDPAYVCDDANIASTVSELVDGAFFNSGQSCCGIERIYVARQNYDAFVEAYINEVKQYVLGNPLEQATTLGPVVRADAADWVRKQNQQAVAAGATACIDPALFAMDTGSSAYLAPQVLVNVDHSMSVMREESFGPTVGIMPVSDDSEAVALMNDSDFGLTASIWGQDLGRIERLGNQLQTGTVYMNRCDYLDPALVWTGVKDTGRGASLSALGYNAFIQPKSFLLQNKY